MHVRDTHACPHIHLYLLFLFNLQCQSGERRRSLRLFSKGVPSLCSKTWGEKWRRTKWVEDEGKKSSSLISTGEWTREGGILQDVFLSPLSTLVQGNTGGLPCGRRRDQYYTRVELDLKWSAHLPWRRHGPT